MDCSETTKKIGILYDGNEESMENVIRSTINLFTNDSAVQLTADVKKIDHASPLEIGFEACKLLKNNVTAMISVTSSCEAQYYLEDMFTSLNQPLLAVEGSICEHPKMMLTGSTITMHPARYHLQQLLGMELIKHLHVGAMTIFFDDTTGHRFVQELISVYTESVIKVQQFYFKRKDQPDDHIANSMKIMKNTSELHKTVIVLCSNYNVIHILHQAQIAGLLRQNFFWIIVGRNISTDEVGAYSPSDSNVAFIHEHYTIVPDTESMREGEHLPVHNVLEASVADAISTLAFYYQTIMKCNGSTNVTQAKAPNMTMCSEIGSDGKSTIRNTIVNMTDFKGYTGVVRFSAGGYRENISFDIHSTHTGPDGVTTMKKVATWTEGNLTVPAELFPNTFSSLNKRELIVATREATPFIFRGADLEPPFVQFTGFCVDILDELAKQYNFSYKMVESIDGKWGAPNEDGSWNGLIGMVIRGEADMAIGPFTITHIRETVIDFTASYLQDGAGIIMKRPEDESKEFRMFRPFHWTIWSAIAGAVLMTGLGVGLINHFEPNGRSRRKDGTFIKDLGIRGSIWTAYRILIHQGAMALPTRHSGRVVVAFYWFFTIITFATYTADLVAFLTVPYVPPPIRTLDELSQQDEIRPICKEGSNLYYLFKDAEGGAYKRVWEMMAGNPTVLGNEEGTKLVNETGAWAFMTDYTQLEYVYNRDCENYVLADEIFNVAGYGFVLPKDSPINTVFSASIVAMQEAGVIQRWKKKWWSTQSGAECIVSTSSSTAQPLGLESCAGAFVVLAASTALSSLVLVIELVFRRCTKACRRKYELRDTTPSSKRVAGNNNDQA
ncbi:glutamate receptor ionotropic, kainate 3-like [Lineus longissimus]|uniref:glutamate receptor ionotropic, kainate 3-like n=1 Tax=Lineus longissimus TaxID=88925 RepID=UPI00315CC466